MIPLIKVAIARWPFKAQQGLEVSTGSSAAHFLERGVRLFLLLGLFTPLLVLLPAAQQPPFSGGTQGRGVPALPEWGQVTPLNANDTLLEEKRLRMLNAQRQKSLVADTGKLLQLASELNSEINAANPAPLSPEQLRKVAEIEKLARSVREKMCLSVKGGPPALPSQP